MSHLFFIITNKFYLLLSLINDASVDIVDDQGFSPLSPEIEFTSLLQQTLKQKHRALQNCYDVKNMLKLLAYLILNNNLNMLVNLVICPD